MSVPVPNPPTSEIVDSRPRIAASRLRGGYEKPRPSLREAIDAKCRECVYDSKSGVGTWREQVGLCTSRECPLYCVRPVARGAKR